MGVTGATASPTRAPTGGGIQMLRTDPLIPGVDNIGGKTLLNRELLFK